MNVRKVTLSTTKGRLTRRRAMTASMATAQRRMAEGAVAGPGHPAALESGAGGEFAVIGNLQIAAGHELDPVQAGANQDIDLRVEERQPADVGDGDLLGLDVELEPLFLVVDDPVGFLRHFVEVGVRP